MYSILYSFEYLYYIVWKFKCELPDLEKQTATNIFLGLFLPAEGKPNIWELPTDFYLHNKNVRAVLEHLHLRYWVLLILNARSIRYRYI